MHKSKLSLTLVRKPPRLNIQLYDTLIVNVHTTKILLFSTSVQIVMSQGVLIAPFPTSGKHLPPHESIPSLQPVFQYWAGWGFLLSTPAVMSNLKLTQHESDMQRLYVVNQLFEPPQYPYSQLCIKNNLVSSKLIGCYKGTLSGAQLK